MTEPLFDAAFNPSEREAGLDRAFVERVAARVTSIAHLVAFANSLLTLTASRPDLSAMTERVKTFLVSADVPPRELAIWGADLGRVTRELIRHERDVATASSLLDGYRAFIAKHVDAPACEGGPAVIRTLARQFNAATKEGFGFERAPVSPIRLTDATPRSIGRADPHPFSKDESFSALLDWLSTLRAQLPTPPSAVSLETFFSRATAKVESWKPLAGSDQERFAKLAIVRHWLVRQCWDTTLRDTALEAALETLEREPMVSDNRLAAFYFYRELVRLIDRLQEADRARWSKRFQASPNSVFSVDALLTSWGK